MKRSTPTGATVLATATMMIFASITVGTTGEAGAEVVARYQAGQWVVEANASNGEFRNCIMSPAHGRGVRAVFMLAHDGQWAVGVMNPAFKLIPGATGRVVYWVDDVIPRGGAAKALDEKTLLVPLENSAQLFEEFRLGSMMNIKVGNETFQFSLDGTSVALAALLGCARRHGQEAQAPK